MRDKEQQPAQGEREFAERALSRLRAKTGFEIEIEAKEPLVGPNLRADFLIRIVAGKFQLPFILELKRNLRSLHQVERFLNTRKSQTAPLLIISESITPTICAELRNSGVGYMDFSGNLYLPIEIFSQTPISPRSHPEHNAIKRRHLSLTSESIVKLGLMLLTNPSGLERPQRRIAQETQLSLGAVNNAMRALLARGLVMQAGGRLRIKAPSEFVNWWANAYNEGLRNSQTIGTFERIPNEPNWWRGTRIEDIEWGGEPAAAQITKYLTPEMMTIYVFQDSPDMRQRLRIVPSENGNVVLLQAFWSKRQEHRWEGIAPLPVVYADLMASNIDRNKETAQMVKDRLLREYEKAHA